MKKMFEMSMIGELSFFLGLQVQQSKLGMFVSQTKYAKELVKKFGLYGKSHVWTPMSISVKLSADLARKSVDQTLYRCMIGSLLYLTTSMPNISCSVGVCARFQANPKESHLTAVKRIIRYVNERQLANLFTKPLEVSRFEFLCSTIGVCELLEKALMRSKEGHCFGVLPCSLDDDKTGVFDGCLLKKVYRRVRKGSHYLKMIRLAK
ncbi:uncharacterized mitochondrial protein AtMg00810-like [Corylus avellana]|uniref:uncharacterized mitochondrial protein AtMg00810-like n=1 Tax=Corylus avellana TaxID=13451 RepID=UPI00286B2A95|nr:uncharacterized mitochondrial protein AtMg00810-like [Corylus avellana]